MITPISIEAVNPRITSPPKKNSASKASVVVMAVMVVRDSVELIATLSSSATGSRLCLRIISRMRS
jgi:hypothetical protein